MANIIPPIFAVASDAYGQACGMAAALDAQVEAFSLFGGATPDKIEAVALARCEAAKRQVKAPCKVFAIGNNIIWNEKKNINME